VSFVGDREQRLILDLLVGRVSDSDFRRQFPMRPEQAAEFVLGMLTRALRERDPVGVEFGLYLGHRFGFSDQHLEILCLLACVKWHERHEDVVDALAKLKSPRCVDVLYCAALTGHAYRQYDETESLGVKCIYVLEAIQTRDATVRLGALLHSGNQVLERQAAAALHRIEQSGEASAARAAREVLGKNRPSGTPEQ
jgi:hypothetical protein